MKPQHIVECYTQRWSIETTFQECREYLEDEMDVVDGDYGQQEPNKAMQLVNMINETFYGPGGF